MWRKYSFTQPWNWKGRLFYTIQHMTSGHYLKVSFNVVSENTVMNFLCSITLTFIGLSWTLNGSFTHASFYHIIWETFVFWVIYICQMITHHIMQYPKIHISNITTHLIRKTFRYWKDIKYIVVDTSYTVLILPQRLIFNICNEHHNIFPCSDRPIVPII